MKYTINKLGTNIRKYRKIKNLSIEQLSELIGISPSFLGLVERGQRGLSIENLCKITDIFNITLDELIFGTLYKDNLYSLTPLYIKDKTTNYDCKIEKILALLYNLKENELNMIIDIITSYKKNIKAYENK